MSPFVRRLLAIRATAREDRQRLEAAAERVAGQILRSRTVRDIEEERAHKAPMPGTIGSGAGRRRDNYVCPARIWGHHPDKEVRKLARAQARESHRLWGPCQKWLEPRTRRTISAVVNIPKPGLRPYRSSMLGRI